MSCSSCSSNNNPNDCSHDCSSCGASSCASREAEQQQCNHDCSSCSEQCAPPKVDQNVYSHIKHVIGVVSGKGGVGKSMVTCSMAAAMAKLGYKTAAKFSQ